MNKSRRTSSVPRSAHPYVYDEQAEFGRLAKGQKRVPLFFRYEGDPLWLNDIYWGRSAFLIAGGPSFAKLDHALLRQPGLLTVGLNNSVKSFRPNLWIGVDRPDHFLRSIWLDPAIQKFVPLAQATNNVFDSNRWEFEELMPAICPNVAFFKRNERFKPEQFLTEDSINFGDDSKGDRHRSVLPAALRILHVLGIRRVFLLGVDFKMSRRSKYHFDEKRSQKSIDWNNQGYELINDRFVRLRPYFEAAGFQVYNCNLRSHLTAFKKVSFADAVAAACGEFGNIDVSTERTRELYETRADAKRDGKGREQSGK